MGPWHSEHITSNSPFIDMAYGTTNDARVALIELGDVLPEPGIFVRGKHRNGGMAAAAFFDGLDSLHVGRGAANFLEELILLQPTMGAGPPLIVDRSVAS